MTRITLAKIGTLFAILGSVLLPLSSANAQNRELPYWASLSGDEVNMRVGPSERFPIDWVYHREGLPVKVVRLNQGWRLVQDADGTQGWMFSRLLTLQRHAIVTGEEVTEIREGPQEAAAMLWKVEPGVVGRLGDCAEGWCEFDVDGRAGWVLENRLWGSGEP